MKQTLRHVLISYALYHLTKTHVVPHIPYLKACVRTGWDYGAENGPMSLSEGWATAEYLYEVYHRK